MPTRQEALLDAAITVLGTQGTRQLTHRAVDTAAGLPAGSASNYFKTRDALIAAIVERFAARDRIGWEAIAAMVQPRDRTELAAALTSWVRHATGTDRIVTVARYALFVEAALRPELQSQLAASAAGIRTWAARWLAAVGSTDPDGDCRMLLDQLEGIMLHRVAFPAAEEADLARQVTDAVHRIVTTSG